MRSRFKNRLLLSFLFVALLTMISSAAILAGTLKNQVEYNYQKQSLEELDSMKKALEANFDDIGQALESVSKDKEILTSLTNPGTWNLKKAYNRLYDKLYSYRKICDFYLLDADGKCILSTENFEEDLIVPVYWGVLKQSWSHPQDLIVGNTLGELIPNKEGIVLSRGILEGEDQTGYLMTVISTENIADLLSGYYSSDCEVAVLDNFFDLIYSSDSELFSDLAAKKLNNYDAVSQRYENLYYYTKRLDCGELILMTGRKSIISEGLRYTLYTAMAVVGVLALIICFLVSRVISKNLTSPLESITDAMNRVKMGDFTVSLDSSRKDEFGQLSRDFDDMTKALKVYIDLRTQNQKEISESNIAMMQAQLNPHFLYNTLDTIKWMAKANHVPQLASLASYLAKILRASISPDIFVSLADEMALLDNYIEIQKIRFSDNFSYDAELPMELEDAIVPKLILQPLVENAIVHGLKDREHGQVFVNAYSEDRKLIVDVEDDGCGIGEDILTILNERDQEKLKGHIGFNNVDRIIRLHYGLNYGLHAVNLTPNGARVTVTLPLRYGDAAVENRKEQLLNDQDSGNR